MLDNKVNVSKFNNEDVIATSAKAYTCKNSPYHIQVGDPNHLGTADEWCKLYSDPTGRPISTDPLPTVLQPYCNKEGYNYLKVDLGTTVSRDDWYYFTGSGWAKCPGKHEE